MSSEGFFSFSASSTLCPGPKSVVAPMSVAIGRPASVRSVVRCGFSPSRLLPFRLANLVKDQSPCFGLPAFDTPLPSSKLIYSGRPFLISMCLLIFPIKTKMKIEKGMISLVSS